jgi:hypothetical protein
MTCGIYKITQKDTDHAYIGLSVNIEHRFSDHKNKPFSSKKQDDQDKVLYKAIRKYGVDKFNFEILEECPKEKLKEREQYWIKYYNTYEDRQHYNETPGGDMPGENTVHIGEEHGRALLTEEDVIQCRKYYAEGKRSRDVWSQYYSDKISYSGFCGMWHGKTWKHVMPEVFNHNPHPSKRTEEDCRIINEEWNKVKDKMSFKHFIESEPCYVGYGTAWKMIHNPDFYKGK